MVTWFRRTVGVAGGVLLVGLLVSCAGRDVVSDRDEQSSASARTSASTGASTYAEVSATRELDYPYQNAKLVPLARTGTTVVESKTAFNLVESGLQNVTRGNQRGPVTASLYSYFNSAYGPTQPDGTVKLPYQGSPVWVFSAPLIRFEDDSQGPPDSPTVHPSTRTNCAQIYVVDAMAAQLLTSWQQCDRS